MNTPSYLTKINDQSKNIEYIEYKSIEEIIDVLQYASTLPHEEYDSVKLYGSSEFIISVLHCIMTNEKYFNNITIASVDISLSDIDPVCKDDYVLILYGDELYIQSSWNDDRLFMNEAKFTICQYGVPEYILHNAMESKTPVQICNLK